MTVTDDHVKSTAVHLVSTRRDRANSQASIFARVLRKITRPWLTSPSPAVPCCKVSRTTAVTRTASVQERRRPLQLACRLFSDYSSAAASFPVLASYLSVHSLLERVPNPPICTSQVLGKAAGASAHARSAGAPSAQFRATGYSSTSQMAGAARLVASGIAPKNSSPRIAIRNAVRMLFDNLPPSAQCACSALAA
jgi:hypothetical protein